LAILLTVCLKWLPVSEGIRRRCIRYSLLAQINRENGVKLKVAWIFHTGDISDGLPTDLCCNRLQSCATPTPEAELGALCGAVFEAP